MKTFSHLAKEWSGKYRQTKKFHAGCFLLLSLFLWIPVRSYSQVSASVELNRKSVYVQEPFHVTITVYTRTWFTQPVEFGNLQIPDAFIVPFDKTVPGMFTFGGKQYPGIQFYYIVFPYKPGNYTVPSLEITAQSPPEGSSQSRKVTIHTTPQPYQVKDIPKELKKKGAWFVAKSITLKETHKPEGQNFKVGDVIQRTITIDASGTLPQFIPDVIHQAQPDWGSAYPMEPVLTDTKGGGDANGRSVQTITYLLEKPGDFTLPEVTLYYWNPYTAKMAEVATHPVKIHVDANPDLGILATLKDSLRATQHLESTPSGEKKRLIMGLPWYEFAGISAAFLILLYILFRIGKRLYQSLRMQRTNYLHSEKYLFKIFLRSKQNPRAFINALYRWWDHFLGKSSASIAASLKESGDEGTGKDLNHYLENTLHNKTTTEPDGIRQSLKKFRDQKQQTGKDPDDDFPF